VTSVGKAKAKSKVNNIFGDIYFVNTLRHSGKDSVEATRSAKG